MTSPSDVLVGVRVDRRRAGAWLIAYGVIGVLVLGVLFIATTFAAVKAGDSLDQVAAARDEIVAVLDDTIAALNTASEVVATASTSVSGINGVTEDASDVAATLSTSLGDLATALEGFEILGRSPLEGAASSLRSASTKLSDLATTLTTAGATLDTGSDQLARLGTQLESIATSLAAPRDRIASRNLDLAGPIRIAAAVLLVLIGWTAVPAAMAIWLGRRWRAEATATTTTGAAPS